MKKKNLLCLLVLFSLFCAAPAFAADIELAKKSTITSILKRGELRIGVDVGYMPFEMTDKNGNYVGFDIDLGREIAKAMGVKLVVVNTDFDGMIPALLADKFDIVLAGMTITPERNLQVGFSDPYIVVGQTLLVNNKHEGKISTWEQLNVEGMVVVARQGTTSEFVSKREFPKAEIRTFEKEADGALEVVSGRADAWVYDLPFNVVFYAEQGKGKVFHLDTPKTAEPLGIAMRQGDPDFMNFINNFLRQLKQDGRYDRMYNKWIKSTDWFQQLQQ